MTLQLGSYLQGDKYRIINVLGQGGFGITYLAYQPQLDRQVAIKEFYMMQYCSRTPGGDVYVGVGQNVELVNLYLNKFIREANVISQMMNPHIIKIFDIFSEHGTAYYVMEFIDGESVADKLNNGPINEDIALNYITQVGEALTFIHNQNYLHLDVKPSNIMVRDNGEAVLIDFGLAKQLGNDGSPLTTTPVGVSNGYAPLEQINQSVVTFSPATDVYSLAATFYAMLSGKQPPLAIDIYQKGFQSIQGVSKSFTDVIKKAMAPRLPDRPQTSAIFIQMCYNARLNSSSSERITVQMDLSKMGHKGKGADMTKILAIFSIVMLILMLIGILLIAFGVI